MKSLLLENFETLADAPNAIPKFRELVLQLAVTGRLVGREAGNAAHRLDVAALAALPPEENSGARHPRVELLELDSSDLPPGWARVSLLDVSRGDGFFRDGDWIESKDQDPMGGVRLIQLADIGDGVYKDQSSRFLTEEKAAELNCSFLQAGDILIARMPAPLGRACRFPGDPKPSVTAVDVCIVRPNVRFFDPDYVVLAINAPASRSWIGVRATGTTRQRISRSSLADLPVAASSIAEQKRIVAKVDELMARCDELEAKQQARRAKLFALNRASLRALTEPNGASLAPAWRRVRDHFDHLYATPETVAELRRTILQLAVMGRLVPQDSNDQPSSELLKKIRAEKERLIAEGKARKAKPLFELGPERFAPELPKGWAWACLADLVASERHAIKRGPFGSAVKKAYFVPSGYKVYEQQHAISGDFARGSYYVPQEKFEELASFEIRPGDVIITCSGTVGKTAIVPDGIERGIINQALLKVTLNPRAMTQRYFRVLFEAYVMSTDLLSELAGTAQKNIVGVAMLKALPLPVPALAEQARIVAKAEELIALCGDMEAKLQHARTAADNLLTAVVHALAFPGKVGG